MSKWRSHIRGNKKEYLHKYVVSSMNTILKGSRGHEIIIFRELQWFVLNVCWMFCKPSGRKIGKDDANLLEFHRKPFPMGHSKGKHGDQDVLKV